MARGKDTSKTPRSLGREAYPEPGTVVNQPTGAVQGGFANRNRGSNQPPSVLLGAEVPRTYPTTLRSPSDDLGRVTVQSVARPLSPPGGRRKNGKGLPAGGRPGPAWAGAVNPPSGTTSFTATSGETVNTGLPVPSPSRALSPDVHSPHVGDVSRNRVANMTPVNRGPQGSPARPQPTGQYEGPTGPGSNPAPTGVPYPMTSDTHLGVHPEHAKSTQFASNAAAQVAGQSTEPQPERYSGPKVFYSSKTGAEHKNPNYNKNYVPTKSTPPKVQPNQSELDASPQYSAPRYTAGNPELRVDNASKYLPKTVRGPRDPSQSNSGFSNPWLEQGAAGRGARSLRQEARLRQSGRPSQLDRNTHPEAGWAAHLDQEVKSQHFYGPLETSRSKADVFRRKTEKMDSPMAPEPPDSVALPDYSTKRHPTYISPGKPGQPQTAKFRSHDVPVLNVEPGNSADEDWPSPYNGVQVPVKNPKKQIVGTQFLYSRPVVGIPKTGIITAKGKQNIRKPDRDPEEAPMAMRENVTRGDFAPKGHHPTTMARADAAGAAALVTAQGVTANRRRLAMNNDAPLTPPKSRDRVGHIRTENTLHPNPDLSETVQRMVPATQRARSRVDGSPMFDAKGKPLMEKILDTITGREINIPAMLPDKVDPVTGDTIKGGPDTYRRPTVSTSHDDSIMFPPAAKAEAAAKVKPKGTAPRKQKTIYGDYMPLP